MLNGISVLTLVRTKLFIGNVTIGTLFFKIIILHTLSDTLSVSRTALSETSLRKISGVSIRTVGRSPKKCQRTKGDEVIRRYGG